MPKKECKKRKEPTLAKKRDVQTLLNILTAEDCGLSQSDFDLMIQDFPWLDG